MIRKRNVLVILCDQLRKDFLSLYGCGAVPTPHLERLAGLGVVFDNAITASTVCAPARASMITGRYVSDHGVWSNDVPFRKGIEFLPERMNELGYTSGGFGKLHHFPASDGKGFSTLSQMEEGRLEEDEPYLSWLRERHPDAERVFNHSNYRFSYPAEDHYEHWIATEALNFMSETIAGEAPFFAWVSFQGPHGPIDPPREVKGCVDSAKLPRMVKAKSGGPALPETVLYRSAGGGRLQDDENLNIRIAYAEQISFIDMQIGRLLDYLEDNDVLEQTTIIFSADHGDMLGDFGLDAKGPFPYPAQLDIPLVLANHPGIQAGTRSLTLAGNIDIAGTALDVAGAERPLGYSRSLIGLAENSTQRREVIFSEFCDSVKTVDDGRYRYSYYPFQNRGQLFDREIDPHCRDDLSGKPESSRVEVGLLRHIVDFMTMAKGVRVEAHDFVPDEQRGLSAKYPDYQRDFPVIFPLSKSEIDRLSELGLDTHYNDFCIEKEIIRYYAKPYWFKE